MNLERILHLLEQELKSVEHSLLGGQLSDYTMYREYVAQRHAFRRAIDIAKQAFQEDEDVEDDIPF